MKEKILISTGGSGGHVILATTIYDHLKNDYEIVISTDLRGKRYLDFNKYKIYEVNTPKLKKTILAPFVILKVLFLIFKSLILLKKEKIQILISTGGYMSLPLCLAAKVLNIKIYLFEPNKIIGRANKFFLNFCEKIICYSKDIIGFSNKFQNKLAISDPIIRKKYYKKNSYEKINKIFTLMIIGGSQGAQIFDEIIHESIVKISKNNALKIIHQTNQNKIEFFKNFYSKNKIENFVFSFNQNLDMLLNQSDLCITRAGASSLAEISFLNIPFIAIPLPTAKDNHQYENAKYYKDKDCCWIINQMNFDKNFFEDLLLEILKNKHDFFEKKRNLKNLNYQNTWNNVNQNLLNIINEN
jgi:UDP-N-acetylglucosamine--N-acetylmuramyl-(pentapeptide) pyrophosphoryl-undecaprenol N-acetylglucosamine transferase